MRFVTMSCKVKMFKKVEMEQSANLLLNCTKYTYTENITYFSLIHIMLYVINFSVWFLSSKLYIEINDAIWTLEMPIIQCVTSISNFMHKWVNFYKLLYKVASVHLSLKRRIFLNEWISYTQVKIRLYSEKLMHNMY